MLQLRFHSNLTFVRSARSRPNTPCTLLVPANLHEDLQRILELKGYGMSKYLRVLVRKYRATCLAYGIPQAGGVKRCYQTAGLQPVRVSFRIENEIWVELGQIAAFLGMSRCFLFTWLLRLEAAGGAKKFVGVPTNSLENYDANYPSYLQYSERLYIHQNRYERRLKIQPCRWRALPSNLRLDYLSDRKRIAAMDGGYIPAH